MIIILRQFKKKIRHCALIYRQILNYSSSTLRYASNLAVCCRLNAKSFKITQQAIRLQIDEEKGRRNGLDHTSPAQGALSSNSYSFKPSL